MDTFPQNGTRNGRVGDGKAREINELVSNMLSRIDLIRGMQTDLRRDIYDSCRLPPMGTAINPDQYWNFYDRECIAARVVEVYPRESWQVQPLVYESEDADTITAFEEDWDLLGQSLRGEESWYQDEEGNPLWNILLQADILSGIGQYGVILLGIDDGKPLNEPAELMGSEKHKLLYMQPYPQYHAKIVEFDMEQGSKRYNKPLMYEITVLDARMMNAIQGTGSGSFGKPVKVHWTRIIHIAEGGDIFGIERMRQVFNNLIGLQKLYCSSPEMYWRGAFPGIGFSVPAQLGSNVHIDRTELSKMMEGYTEDLQRWFAVKGLTPQQFATQVVDPSPQINVHIEGISIKIGVPVRIFKGSERGELASTQDDDAWNDRIKLRQKFHLTPRILIPVVDRLIALGVLSEPQGYSVYWPDITSRSKEQKVESAKGIIEVMVKYISGGVEALMTPLDFLTRVLDFNEEEATAILEAAAEALEEKKAAEEEAARLLAEEEGDEEDSEDGQFGEFTEDEEEEEPTENTLNWEVGYDPETGETVYNNCGIGAGGFQPGNQCAKGGSGGGDSGEGRDSAEETSKALHGKPKDAPNVTVRYVNSNPSEDSEAAVKRVFGDKVDINRVAAASNAKEGAKVTVQEISGSNGFQVTVRNPDGGVAIRSFYKTPGGEIFVNNKLFENPPGAKERGADVLAEQVKSLRELGVSHMKTDATRNDDTNPPMVGHKVWPKLGYEGKLTDDQFSKLPDDVQAAMGEKKGKFGLFGKVKGSRSVQQLYATNGGPEAWDKTGTTIYNMTFDLKDNSPSMNKLATYLAGRKQKG